MSKDTKISNKQTCPYLNTIDRRALDFDFEKICSVSLSKVNIYACLVCGKYFQGRGKSSHAFIHSVSDFHHVFLNLETLKFYCLPDNYEIIDESLNDILHDLKPVFTHEQIDKLDINDKHVETTDGKAYYLGIVGLNNLKYNDYCNVIFQALSHVIPLRNYFLIESNYAPTHRGDEKYILLLTFGNLIRKLWNPRNFKTHVSPHEMLQAITFVSKKKFEITHQNDPIVFLVWFLNSLLGPKRERNSIIKQTFEGQILIRSRLILPNVGVISEESPSMLLSEEEELKESSFLYLTLDMPPMPLFPKKDEKGKVIQPRVSVYELLSKYNGEKQHEYKGYNENSIRKYEILRLPKYLILYYKRLTKNAFFIEKNTHIIDSPLKNLNMSLFMSRTNERDCNKDERQPISNNNCNFNLISNIIHDGDPQAGKGTYKIQIYHRGSQKWFEIQDLYVTEISDSTRISVSASYIQIWERTSDTAEK